MAETTDPNLCKHYLVQSLNQTKLDLDLCSTKLNTQAQSWISTLRLLDILNNNLKEFVRLQNKHLSNKFDKQLVQYKDILDENQSLQQMSFYLTSNDQVLVNELINLQQLQIELMKEFVMLEQRIICKVLPHHFESLDKNLIKSDIYKPFIHDMTAIEFTNEQNKIIQQIKRTRLNIYFNGYEMKIQEYEDQYNEKPDLFQLQFEYYRKQLLDYRKRSSKARKIIDVSPKPTIYLAFNSFNNQELDYLAKGPNYIRSNQSAIVPNKKRNKLIKTQHDKIFNQVKNYLDPNHYLAPTLPIYNIYAQHLQNCLQSRYSTPLSMANYIRIKREFKIVQSILQKLKKYKLILRETDKSGVFCILRTQDHEQKAKEYRDKTEAYKELPGNPFKATLNKVIRLLNDLHAKHGKLEACPYK